MAKWSNDRVWEVATGRTWRVLERYILPGKNTGFVLVCGNRACFTEIRGYQWPLGLLPRDVSPEDRKAVVKWAAAESLRRTEEAFNSASRGTPPPNPLRPKESE